MSVTSDDDGFLPQSGRVGCQAIFTRFGWFHLRFSRSIALRMTMSFCLQTIMITLGGLQAVPDHG